VSELRGRTVVVTGASAGIGEAAARELARRGATLVPVGRDARRLRRVADRLGSSAEPFQADFASLEEVRDLAGRLLERHERIHVLVNNAGLVSGRRTVTPDGHELTFQVNHLAPFLLTNLLLDRLRGSAPSRVVITSSDAHHSGRMHWDDLQGEGSFSGWGAYAQSKLANVLFTRALARRLEGEGVTANCLHPGVIRTRLNRGLGLPMRLGWSAGKPFLGSPRRGAQTIVHLAASEEGGRLSGLYWSRSKVAAPSAAAVDDQAGERLWRESERMVGLGAFNAR
jgi:NAD(P)-dependent dehydrogenase (short-subunit alcohol dehydrogenase family)